MYNSSEGSVELSLSQLIHERLRQADIRDTLRFREQRGDLPVAESGDAAADAGDVEEQLGMPAGECDEIVHVKPDGIYPALHCGDGVALPLQADALTPHGPENLGRDPRRPSGMHPVQVAPEDENLVRLQVRNAFRGEIRAGDGVVFSHRLCKFRIIL